MYPSPLMVTIFHFLPFFLDLPSFWELILHFDFFKNHVLSIFPHSEWSSIFQKQNPALLAAVSVGPAASPCPTAPRGQGPASSVEGRCLSADWLSAAVQLPTGLWLGHPHSCWKLPALPGYMPSFASNLRGESTPHTFHFTLPAF